jgi:urate oxidase
MNDKIYYGKGNIALYRSYATPLKVAPIPESTYTGQPNTIFAVDLDVEVFGSAFMPAYTEGDNTMVVPTATITNFAFRKSLGFAGATLENFVHYLGEAYLHQYSDMERVRLTARELPFAPQPITRDAGEVTTPSDRLLAPSFNHRAKAQVTLSREGVLAAESGLDGIKLIKLTGSAFANFPQDEFTTLPQRNDRPLYIFMDMGWRYASSADAVDSACVRYIPPAQVYDHIADTFHDFVSMSIQHLVYEMGIRLLRRFPQMSEVWFDAQNRLWDTAAEQDGSDAKVFMDPRPPYGMIGITLTRADVKV